MWCSQCRQDVPGIAGTDRQGYRCPCCGESLGLRTATASTECPATAANAQPAAEAPLFLPDDDWEIDERLKHIERVLRRRSIPAGQSADTGPRLRFDSSHPGVSARRANDGRDVPAGPHAGSLGMVIWSTLSLGLTGLVCGGILLCWAVLADRGELWTVGLPIAVGGQIVLSFGLILQIDRLWQEHRPVTVRHSGDSRPGLRARLDELAAQIDGTEK